MTDDEVDWIWIVKGTKELRIFIVKFYDAEIINFLNFYDCNCELYLPLTSSAS